MVVVLAEAFSSFFLQVAFSKISTFLLQYVTLFPKCSASLLILLVARIQNCNPAVILHLFRDPFCKCNPRFNVVAYFSEVTKIV